MENKSLTAVEWLWNELADKGYFKKLPISEIKQAKQMEKDQIIDAFDMGCQDEDRIGKEYYNETYGEN